MKPKLSSYITGFVLSAVLTLAAYFIVQVHVSSVAQSVIAPNVVLASIFGLAIVQLLVQLFFFLHLGRESGPKWNLGILISTVGLILLIVVGSIWIMYHLNYNMTPQQIDQYLQQQNGAF